jgi:hypothetical protein
MRVVWLGCALSEEPRMRLLRFGLVALALGGVLALGVAYSRHAGTSDAASIAALRQQVQGLSATVDRLDGVIAVDADGTARFATPTPVPIVQYHEYGFSLPVPQNVQVTAAGLSGDAATRDSGSIVASAGGTSVLLVWSDPTPPLTPQESVMSAFDVLQSLTQTASEPQRAGADLTVDGEPGAYGTFVARDGAGNVEGAGIIGGWVCSNDDRSYAMAVTGATSDAVQQSFVALAGGFTCDADAVAAAR